MCLREAKSTVIDGDLKLNVKISLMKDTSGNVRRDVQEDKENQVQGIILNKIKECLDFEFADKDKDADQIMQVEHKQRPLELLISLNVIQDP